MSDIIPKINTTQNEKYRTDLYYFENHHTQITRRPSQVWIIPHLQPQKSRSNMHCRTVGSTRSWVVWHLCHSSTVPGFPHEGADGTMVQRNGNVGVTIRGTDDVIAFGGVCACACGGGAAIHGRVPDNGTVAVGARSVSVGGLSTHATTSTQYNTHKYHTHTHHHVHNTH